jgi:aminopeptidase N
VPLPQVFDGSTYLNLKAIAIDGVALTAEQYSITGKQQLIVHAPPAAFKLSITVAIDPVNNTSLEGLYKSSGNFCTQVPAARISSKGVRCKATQHKGKLAPSIRAAHTQRID